MFNFTFKHFHLSNFLCNKELEEQLAEQKKLLKSVASRGEEILNQQASPSGARSISSTEKNGFNNIIIVTLIIMYVSFFG